MKKTLITYTLDKIKFSTYKLHLKYLPDIIRPWRDIQIYIQITWSQKLCPDTDSTKWWNFRTSRNMLLSSEALWSGPKLVHKHNSQVKLRYLCSGLCLHRAGDETAICVLHLNSKSCQIVLSYTNPVWTVSEHMSIYEKISHTERPNIFYFNFLLLCLNN